VLVRLTLDQFIFWPKLPSNAGFGIKNLQKFFPEVTPPDPLSGRGRPPSASTPSMATRRARGRKLPRCWDLGLGNRSPKSKFTTTPLITLNVSRLCRATCSYTAVRQLTRFRLTQRVARSLCGKRLLVGTYCNAMLNCRRRSVLRSTCCKQIFTLSVINLPRSNLTLWCL